MTAYVLDASVAAKWILPARDEPLNAEAVRLLEAFAAGEMSLSVPDLFWAEIGNILWKAVRAARITAKTAAEGMDWLLALDIPTESTRPLAQDALAIAISFQRPVYDAVYLSLAIQSGRPLVTADERLVSAVGALLPVRWLGSFA